MSKPENPPAFPTKRNANDPRNDGFITEDGMSLRDYFAAKAMAALIVSRPPQIDGMGYILPSEWRPIISGAFKLADEMIQEREKGRK